MPDFYYGRVARHLGMQPAKTNVTLAQLRERIATLRPLDNAAYLAQLPRIKQMVEAITARGGKVVFVAMPTSGMIREIDETLYPRKQFWDQFVREIGVTAVRATDLAALSTIECPDGSHVDQRDRERVTLAVASALGLSK